MELQYNGNKIEQRESDGYVNATQMAKANGKRLDNYMRLESTAKYIEALGNSLGSEVVLIKSVKGVYGGTFIHPLLAIHLGQWISPEFHVWCNTHIKTLMEKGTTSLVNKRDAIDYIEVIPKLEAIKNPMMRSILEQRLMEDISSTKALPGNVPQTCVLTVRASILGYSDKEIAGGSALGKYVAKRINSLGKQPHGRYYVHTYLVTEELDQCIHDFFNQGKIGILNW